MRRARGPLFVLSTLLVAAACGSPDQEVLAPEQALFRVSAPEPLSVILTPVVWQRNVVDLPEPAPPRPVDLWLDAGTKAATYAQLEAARLAEEKAAAEAEAERVAAEIHVAEHRAEESRIVNRESRTESRGTASTPESSSGASGGVNAHLEGIAQCESGGDPSAVSPSGKYHGKYQFSQETWNGVGGTGSPSAAPEAEQDKRAQMLYDRSGPGQWPVCSKG